VRKGKSEIHATFVGAGLQGYSKVTNGTKGEMARAFKKNIDSY